MTFAVSIDVIKAELTARIDQVVAELFPNAQRNGREWVMGDIHGAPGASLSICRTGSKAGWWKDFNGGAKGDVITLFAAGMCEGDLKAAIPAAVRWLKLDGLTPAELQRQERKAAHEAAKRAADTARKGEEIRRAARGHWHGAAPIGGTPADTYLLGRGIDVRRLVKPPGSLRFKGMRCPLTERERPCLLAIVNHPTSGEQLAVHRTFLEVLADGRVVKADHGDVPASRRLPDAKMAYGSYAGGFIPLARGASGKPIGQAPAGERLVVSEGIEDGLSVALALPSLRVGAALSLSNMGGLVLPPGMGLTIAAQNDTKPEAVKALGDAQGRLRSRGVVFDTVFPAGDVKDWNDWLQLLATPEGGRVEVRMGRVG